MSDRLWARSTKDKFKSRLGAVIERSMCHYCICMCVAYMSQFLMKLLS